MFRRRRGNTSIAANPVLIGAATTLVVVVAVFLAYNANSGLPFIPTYDVRVEVPNAAGLVEGNDVRVGGTRVGIIDKITPVTQDDGTVTGTLDLKLDEVVKPIATDTTVMVRPRSALGLKYVQLTRGTGSEDVPNGGALPLSQANPIPVEIDEFFDMFDEETRRGAQGSLQAFGDAFTGRGADINLAIQELDPLLDDLVPVLQNLGSHEDRPARLLRGPGPERGCRGAGRRDAGRRLPRALTRPSRRSPASPTRTSRSRSARGRSRSRSRSRSCRR